MSAVSAADCVSWLHAADIAKNVAPVAAVIAATGVAAVGWVVKEMIAFAARNWVQCRERINLMVALCSQIASNFPTERYYGRRKALSDLLLRFDVPTGTRHAFIPYVVTTEAPPITAKLSEQFHILPVSVSPHVQEYFDYSESLDTQLKDFRSETFKCLSRERQKDALRETFSVGRATAMSGIAARRSLLKEICRQKCQRTAVWSGFMIIWLVTASISGLAVNHWVKTGLRWVAVSGATCPKPSIVFSR